VSSARPPSGATRRRVLSWLDPRDLPTGSADDREDTPGPETTDSGQGAADLATGHQKQTNAVAGGCDLTTLVPIGRGSGGRGQEERAASSGMLSTDPGFTGTDGPPAGD